MTRICKVTIAFGETTLSLDVEEQSPIAKKVLDVLEERLREAREYLQREIGIPWPVGVGLPYEVSRGQALAVSQVLQICDGCGSWTMAPEPQSGARGYTVRRDPIMARTCRLSIEICGSMSLSFAIEPYAADAHKVVEIADEMLQELTSRAATEKFYGLRGPGVGISGLGPPSNAAFAVIQVVRICGRCGPRGHEKTRA